MAYSYPHGLDGDFTDDTMPRSRIVFSAKEVANIDYTSTATNIWDGIPFAAVGKAIAGAALPNVRETTSSADNAFEYDGAQVELSNADKAKHIFANQGRSASDNLKSGKLKDLASSQITQTVKKPDGSISSWNEQCFLYTPQAIQIDDRFSYNNAELGLGGAAASMALQQTNNLGSAMGAAIGNIGAGISDFKDMVMGGQISNLAAVRASQGAFGLKPPEAVTNAIGLAAQITVNPNLRTLFKGVQVRSFSFQFQFLPSSPAEAKEVEEIIKFFRHYAHPDTKINGESLGAFGYKFPDRFAISIEHYNNGWVEIEPAFLESYLTNISVTYNPNASVYFDDGKPTQTNLTLSFMEYRALDKSDLKTPTRQGGVFVDIQTGSPLSEGLIEGSGLDGLDFIDRPLPTGIV